MRTVLILAAAKRLTLSESLLRTQRLLEAPGGPLRVTGPVTRTDAHCSMCVDGFAGHIHQNYWLFRSILQRCQSVSKDIRGKRFISQDVFVFESKTSPKAAVPRFSGKF